MIEGEGFRGEVLRLRIMICYYILALRGNDPVAPLEDTLNPRQETLNPVHLAAQAPKP